MIPFLTYPLALLGLVAVPAFLMIYFFRSKFRRTPVSSLVLWESVVRAKEGGAKMARLRTPLIFFLELAVILLLVLAAIDMRWPITASRRRLIVVLDDSVSMRAKTGSSSARSRAGKALLSEIKKGRFYAVHYILASRRPKTLGYEGMSIEQEARMIMDQWRCMESSSALDESIVMALESGGKSSRILVLTDHAPTDVPESNRLKWISTGMSVPNMGFVNAARSAGTDSDRCFVEIANFSRSAAGTELSLEYGNSNLSRRKKILLSAGETEKFVFEVPHDAPDVHMRLSSDGLEEDNELHLLQNPEEKIRIAVDVENETLEKLLVAAIDSTGVRSSVRKQPHIVFTDKPGRATVAGVWNVAFGLHEGAKAFVGPFVVNNSHPLSDGLDFEGVVWGTVATNSSPGVPVVMAGNIPLVADYGRSSGAHDISIQFSPTTSTIQHTPNWPVLIWNILNWRIKTLPGVDPVNVRIGINEVFNCSRSIEEIEVLSPSGMKEILPVSGGRAVVVPEIPGVYEITAGERSYRFAANMLSAPESDLRGCRKDKSGRWENAESLKKEYASSSWVFILLALGVLAFHQKLLSSQGNIG